MLNVKVLLQEIGNGFGGEVVYLLIESGNGGNIIAYQPHI
jgi:hypothetical protein